MQEYEELDLKSSLQNPAGNSENWGDRIPVSVRGCCPLAEAKKRQRNLLLKHKKKQSGKKLGMIIFWISQCLWSAHPGYVNQRQWSLSYTIGPVYIS